MIRKVNVSSARDNSKANMNFTKALKALCFGGFLVSAFFRILPNFEP